LQNYTILKPEYAMIFHSADWTKSESMHITHMHKTFNLKFVWISFFWWFVLHDFLPSSFVNPYSIAQTSKDYIKAVLGYQYSSVAFLNPFVPILSIGTSNSICEFRGPCSVSSVKMVYKLTYFDMPGRAESIRMIFTASNIKFIDNRITGLDFQKLKPSELLTNRELFLNSYQNTL